MRRLLIAGLLVVALVGGLAVWRSFRAGAEEPEEETEQAPVPVRIARVRRGTVAGTFRLIGTLDVAPNGRARIAAPIAGRLAVVRIRRGDRVRAGEVLATLVAEDLAADAARAAAAAADARQQVAGAEADVRRQQVTQHGDIAAAEAKRHAAEARLALLRAGNRPEEIAQAEANTAALRAQLARAERNPLSEEVAQSEAALREAQAERTAAQQNAARKRRLFDQGIVAGKEVERATADLAVTEARVASGTEALQLLRRGTRPEELQALRARVQEGEAQLAVVRAGARPEAIREAEAGIREAEAAVEQARAGGWQVTSLQHAVRAARARAAAAAAEEVRVRAEQAKSVIRSPVDGTITDLLLNQGEVVNPGDAIAEVARLSTLRVLAQAPAPVAASLAPGMPVRITFPELPRLELPGRLQVVGRGVTRDTGMVPVEVSLLRGGEAARERGSEGAKKTGAAGVTPSLPRSLAPAALRVGLAAAVEVALPPAAGTLVIPRSCVFARAGENYVYVLDAEEKAHERQVDLGAENGADVRVTAGLREGERVVLDGTLSLADETPVKVDS